MSAQFYLQLFSQLSQWIQPRDKRHLDGFAEMLSTLLLIVSTQLSQWLVARRQKPNCNVSRAALASLALLADHPQHGRLDLVPSSAQAGAQPDSRSNVCYT